MCWFTVLVNTYDNKVRYRPPVPIIALIVLQNVNAPRTGHIRTWYLPRNISSGSLMQMQNIDKQYTWKYMKWTHKSDRDWVRTIRRT